MVQRNGLFRSRTNRMLGGVASGLAYNLNSDPTLIRVIFLLLTVFWGGGVLLYIILWIALPEEDIPAFQQPGASTPGAEGSGTPDSPYKAGDPTMPPARRNNALVVGLILIAAGAIFLISRFVPHVHYGDLWPFVLVIAGIVLIMTSFSKTTKF